MAPPRIYRLKESCRRELDINALVRGRFIQPGAQGLISFGDGTQFGFFVWQTEGAHYEEAVQAFPGGVRLTGENGLHEIGLAWSACHYGGERPWFLCPECNRRVVKLVDYGEGFQCRHCADYRYRSQSIGPARKLLSKANKLRARLNPDETRPRGMHHKTYELLCQQIGELDMQAFDIVAARTK